ncbi:hypothetical protein FN846DRAFT_931386 [Sphaerosporella brunnea]|uniref:Uncharacterized protein n=1 Tax=Sphaerosporella brunnea TaxID=1250544 RepID=A0A5J5F882_9PEZI|nr:hypothetical protein FN846DRAFT_931386 [Sphaerosporella brunnea]
MREVSGPLIAPTRLDSPPNFFCRDACRAQEIIHAFLYSRDNGLYDDLINIQLPAYHRAACHLRPPPHTDAQPVFSTDGRQRFYRTLAMHLPLYTRCPGPHLLTVGVASHRLPPASLYGDTSTLTSQERCRDMVPAQEAEEDSGPSTSRITTTSRERQILRASKTSTALWAWINREPVQYRMGSICESLLSLIMLGHRNIST